MSRTVTDAGWSRIVDAFAGKAKKLHGLREGALHHTRENHALGAHCVLTEAGRRQQVIFVSRSLEEHTGLSTASALGKSHLEFLFPATHWLDDLFNSSERRHLVDFYQGISRGSPHSGSDEDQQLLSLMVFCKAAGQPFWSLVHSFPVEVPQDDVFGNVFGNAAATKYILHILTPLEPPVPSTLWITEAGEARLAAKANVEVVKPHLDQVSQDIKARKIGIPVFGVVPTAERRVRVFAELMADAFLGTRFVPRLGREPAAEFEGLGLREKVFEAIEHELKKAWEASDEACRNSGAGFFVPRGNTAIACAVSDPTAQDCPLVYISSGFEELTGYRASWATGRNCRFLQPQQAGHAPVAINRSEVERLNSFCKARSGNSLSLLLNETQGGKFFWNLLFMQHLFLPTSSDNHGMPRHFIFAVQTEIKTPDLTELILRSWDSGAGPYRLQRLREIIYSHEPTFNPREKSLFALCGEVFSKWADEVSIKNTTMWTPIMDEVVVTGSGGEVVDEFAAHWPAVFSAAEPTLRRIFRMGDRDLDDMRANMPGGVVFCLSEPEEKDCPIVFVSKGFEEMTGFKEDYACGKNCRFLQPVVQEVNSTVNGEELLRLRTFCDMSRGRHHDSDAIVCLLLNERKTGERFWNLLHMHHLSAEGKKYILGVQSILRVPMPTMLRAAKNFTPVEEAQLSHFLQQLGQLMGKVRPLVNQQGIADMQCAVQLATESLRSFLESACPDYEGDHWVPCVGLREANVFQKDMLWKRAFDEMKSSLKKIWEVSEGCEEEVAIAIADPSGKDCPLVYVSSKFENITGYSRDWVIGRNCRFLQPNTSWCNALFNREEVRAMHSFCEDAMPRGTRIVNLLVNEHKNQYPFINLLVMEHIEVAMPKEDPEPGVLYQKTVHKPFIFGVQTALDGQTFALVELLAMDREGIKQLDRLRAILRRREGTLRFQSLNTFARECIAEWMPGVPGYFSLPRVRLGAPTSWRRASVPSLGLEVTAQNILETVPQALEEGVRHFYLTFVADASDKNAEGQAQLQGKLLSLRLTELFNMMVPGYYHYLRGNISFTLVTPPMFVRAYEEVARAFYVHSYMLDAWMLDLRGCPDRWDVRYSDYWKLMSGIRTAGGVGNIGVVGASRHICDKINIDVGAMPIGIFGVELYPQKQWQDLREKTYFEQQVGRGALIVAYGIFGPRQCLLESEAVGEEAERLKADPATVLMKWVEGQGFAMLLPRLRLYRSKQPISKGFTRQISTESHFSSSSRVSQSGPSTQGREPNFHRTFAREYSKLLPGVVDSFFRRCHNLHRCLEEGAQEIQAPTSPPPQGGPSPRARRASFGAQVVDVGLRSVDDGAMPSRPRSASRTGAGCAMSGSSFDAQGVRKSMKLSKAATSRASGDNMTGTASKEPPAGLQSLALEFSLAVPAPPPRPANQYVRKASTGVGV